MSPVPRTKRFRIEKNESIKLKALSDIASIDVTLEFDRILNDILKITCESMNAHSGTIMLVDDITKQLEMAASYGLPNDYIKRVYELAKKFDMPISTSPSGIVLETGKYYLVPNVFKESRDKPWAELAKELGFSSQIFTPMKKGSKIIGLLNIYNAKTHDFTDEEIDFANIAASQASSVVQNARMCNRLRKNIIELKDYEQHLQEKIKESHNALYESEKKYRKIIENASDGIYTSDAKGYFLTMNEAGLKMFGCSREEMIGTHFSKWLTKESLELFQDGMRKDFLNSPVKQPKILEFHRKDGWKLTGEIRSNLIKEGNKILEVHGIIRDVTEKVRLEQELKVSEAKYRELFENAQNPMYVLDNKYNFINMNQVGLQMLGYIKEEVMGCNISKILTPESLKNIEDRRKKCLLGEIVDQTDVLEIVCKNGEHKWIEINTREIKKGDRPIEIHGMAKDITENIKLKKELKKSNKQQKILCYLIKGTRGGKTRTLILNLIIEENSLNAHQIAKSLDLDYKTIRHHLKVLVNHGIIYEEKQENKSTIYFISKNVAESIFSLDEVF